MDPELLEEAIKDRIAKNTKKPKAIIPVALYGMPYQIYRILEVANRYDIPVIEDAAEGFGSKFNGQVLGTFGRYGVISFNGNKMITTVGGGTLICPDDASRKEIMWNATQARESYPYYQHEVVGYNYRLSNISACIGQASTAVTDCQLNDNVEALRIALYGANIESRPLLKPMHKQPVFKNASAYINGISESLFKVGICLPTGPWAMNRSDTL